MRISHLFFGSGIVALSACAAATPPTITTDDIAAANTEFNRVNALAVIDPADLPSGTASYSGKLGGDITVDGDPNFSVLGDLDLSASFAGAGNLSGSVSNINLIEDGTPDQLLGGQLNISGTTASNTFTATATGTLDAVGTDLPFRGETRMQLSLAGDVRDDATAFGAASALQGTWAGGSTGANNDFEVTGASGNFFATEN